MLRSLIVLSLLASNLVWAAPNLVFDYPHTPDSEMTTGDFCTKDNPDFEGYRYAEKIAYCTRNVDWTLKQKIYDAYGVPEKCRREYTIDHYIPLALGGSNETANLWPEHKNVKATRQTLEQELFEKINAGKIAQADAVREIVHAKQNPGPSEPAPCN